MEPIVNKALSVLIFFFLLFAVIGPISDFVSLVALAPSLQVRIEPLITVFEQKQELTSAAIVGPAPVQYRRTRVVYVYQVEGKRFRGERTQKVSWVGSVFEGKNFIEGERVTGCYSLLSPSISSLNCDTPAPFDLLFVVSAMLISCGAVAYVAYRFFADRLPRN